MINPVINKPRIYTLGACKGIRVKKNNPVARSYCGISQESLFCGVNRESFNVVKYQKKSGVKILICLFLFSIVASLAQAKDYKYPYSSFKERDPFKPLVNKRGNILIREKKGIGDFLLQGIMYSPKGSQVIINNEVFKEGDIVEGYKIKRIDVYKVIFEKKGEEFVLKWGE